MKQSIFIALVLFIMSCSQEIQDPKANVERFFLTYEEKGIDNALDYVFQTNEWLLRNSTDEIINLKTNLNANINIIGNYTGYEIISERSIGESLKHYSCIVKFDRQPLRFSFMFYNAGSSWVLYNFKYDDNLIDELDEAAKFYYLK